MKTNLLKNNGCKQSRNFDFFSQKKILVLLLMLAFSLACVIFLFFKSSSDIPSINTIKTSNGVIKFAYNEGENVINLSSAYPIKDITGIKMSNDNEYFDFSIKGLMSKGKINYKVTVEENVPSLISNSYVKVYLTEVSSGKETAVLQPTLFADLNHYDTNEWVILEKTVSGNFDIQYRFRMWIDENATIYDNTGDTTIDITGESFSVKLNVYANQI